MYFYVQDLSLY